MIEKIRTALFKVFKKDTFLGKLVDKVFTKEIIMYLVFGVATTLVNYITYTLLIKLVTENVTLCNAIAWGVSVLFAFFTNKLFVFESKSFAPLVFLKELISFILSRAVTGAMEIFLPDLLMKIGLDQKVFGVKGMAAKLVVSIVVVILNYVFGKLISFRKKKE